MKALHMIAWILLVVGGLNWLLYAFGWDLGTWISASWWTGLMRIVYILVGLSAVLSLFTHKKDCKCCDTAMDNKVA